MGLRYRVHVRPLPDLRREADISFQTAQVAVFVDGCFWHSCPEHGSSPASHGTWWAAKLAANVRRDRDTDERLRAAGWLPVRIWEHEPPADAADRVAAAVASRRPSAGAGATSRRPAHG